MTDSQLDRLIEKLPYSDGSGRRRFVAGGILVLGIAIINWESVQTAIGEDVAAIDIIRSPIVAAGALLLIYAIGSLVELLGDVFLVRAAAGIFWSFSLPWRFSSAKKGLFRPVAYFGAALAVPVVAIWNFLRGLLGQTEYRLGFESLLTPSAEAVFGRLPARVASGLSQPVGDYSEMALKHLVEMFPNESDRKWAWRIAHRAKEVSATTTALFLLVVILFSMGEMGLWSSSSELFSQEREELSKSIDELAASVDRMPTPSSITSSNVRTLRNSTGTFRPEVAVEWYLDFTKGLTNLFLGLLDASTERVIAKLEAGRLRIEKLEERLAQSDAAGERLPLEEGEVREDTAGLQVAVPRMDEVNEQLVAVQTAATKLRDAGQAYTARRAASRAALAIPFLFLYIGFFRSLRSAIVSIIESLAIRTAPVAEAVTAEGSAEEDAAVDAGKPDGEAS